MKLEGSHLRRAFIAYGLKLLEDITVIRLNVILEKNIVRVCPYLRNLVGDKKTWGEWPLLSLSLPFYCSYVPSNLEISPSIFPCFLQKLMAV